MLETLTALAQPWADLYSASGWLPTAVIALHVLALFTGGGIAVGADRRVLLARPGSNEGFVAVAEELHSTHGIVVGTLVLMVLTGSALATADLGTFALSPVFWAKMAAFAALIGNGVLMRRTEGRLLVAAHSAAAHSAAAHAKADANVPNLWSRLRLHAGLSLAGWFVVVLLGVIVANV